MANPVEDLMADFRADDGVPLARLIRMVEDGEEESQYLEFKELGNDSGKVDDDVKRTLAKQLSGFANGGGGILIWGVRAPNDVAKELRPIPNVANFRYRLDDITSKAVTPPLTNVEHIAIADRVQTDNGYVVTCVPDGAVKPHRSVAENLHTYYLRANKTTEIMPDSAVRAFVTSGARPSLKLMFKAELGRLSHVQRTQGEWPSQTFQLTARVSIRLVNDGSVLAEQRAYALESVPSFRIVGSGNGRNVMINAEDGSYEAKIFMLTPPEVLYPGMEEDVGYFDFSTFGIESHDAYYRPKEDLSLRYGIYARNFTRNGRIVIPKDCIRAQ